jgi:hypothetical protein
LCCFCIFSEGAGWGQEYQSSFHLFLWLRAPLTEALLYLGGITLSPNLQWQRIECQGGFVIWNNLSEERGKMPQECCDFQAFSED